MQPRIPCYVLVFREVEIVKRTLEFLTRFTDKLELVIIENPSKNSTVIGDMIDQYGRRGLVKRFYSFEKNITNNAFDIVLTKEMDHIKSHTHLMITDGDLVSGNKGWLEEELAIMEDPGVFACGISLDTSNLPLATFPDAYNWIPADQTETTLYFEAFTGVHLLLMRSRDFVRFMNWRVQNRLNFIDGEMHRYCREEVNMKWTRTKYAKAHHLTWDLYQSADHPYTKLKMSKSFQDTWRHGEQSAFSLKSY